MSYAALHVHSAFSPQWGVRSVEDICAAARALGLRHLALTDRNGLYGVPHFLEVAKAHGLLPLIGAETVKGGQRAVLLARDAEGYANLCRLLSDLHCRADFDLAQSLCVLRRGLTVLSDDAAVLMPLRRQSRANLYVELSPGHQMHRALALSRELGLPPVATSRAVLLEPQDYEIHRVLRAIALNTKLSRLSPDELAGEGDRLLSPQHLADFFPHCPQALDNTLVVAADCRSDWDFSASIFPAFRGLADGEAFAALELRARQGALWRYGQMNVRIEERLCKELSLIRDKGFAHYFLVVEELVRQSPRTCGRGSAAASLVAYCLGITHVDPIAYNLFFERFLNEGRLDPPDIDIDFPWDERDAVLDFAFQRYGARRAAMVANQVKFKGRSSLREVAKVFGFQEDEIKTLTARLSGYCTAGRTAAAIARDPQFKGEALSDDWQQVLRLAQRLDGQLRHLSLHCGGLVVVPDEIRRYVPVEVAAKGLPLIQWEKDQAEAAGLVKIDILGNRSLAVIRDALAAVKRHTGREIDYATWQPLDDERTRQLLRSGGTMGCFYIESPATRQLLKRMFGERQVTEAADLFEHLVMASSIIRPAANVFIREFVARMRGKAWTPLHPLLDEVLNETYGLAVYQEQITQVAMALADFSAFEGDQLRKIISKKHKAQTLRDYHEKFLAGGRKKCIDGQILGKVWAQILSFSGYSFCKPHSASYALVSCKSAWLKANYPAEFMAAVISNQGGFYSPLAYLSEARRMGLEVLPPDINAGDHPYIGQGRELRVGFMQIQGLSGAAVKALLAARTQGGEFVSFRDFLRRVRMDIADTRLLIKAGCFDALEGKERRPALLWELLGHRHAAPASSASLFDEPALELPTPPAYADKQVLAQELETLGLLASCHPLVLHRGEIARLKPVFACRMAEWSKRYITMIGWWVTGKTVQDKDGRPMEFVSFEDTTGIFDATFFPQAYARFCRKLSRLRPYVLKGKVEEEFGVTTLTVEWVGFLEKKE
ncbi:DNA polymerase III, alpha subunit [Geoalkalibacter ferrihydriticus]|uniref:DNA-directed DNA polymerase n=2 Tax=Geoalkalibacter ferrihydriticus TaxID=392333 RepID=A0A0C2DUZ7_9BACT|nr:DNA polymerase III subunit alpha [Geoalkalibacter ferrihydriticus]KIH77249.1 DNA polymerase III subunit alpha [Geoalkalibacter ferrihydriticus DSM 17813]SDM23408.1 DNA polymerase III, alpha subunit [Geoalkalibacter ferrihydriticus]